MVTVEKIRNQSYWKGYADGFNGVWDAVDEMILLRQKGRPLTWKMARKLTLQLEREGAKSTD